VKGCGDLMTYEDRCEMCNDIVHTYEFEDGYGGHSYDHQTLKPYEDRRISLPERENQLTVKVCTECQLKEPSLYSLIRKKRIEWLTEEMKGKKNRINHIRKEIKGLQDSIPKIRLQIKIFRDLKKEIEK